MLNILLKTSICIQGKKASNVLKLKEDYFWTLKKGMNVLSTCSARAFLNRNNSFLPRPAISEEQKKVVPFLNLFDPNKNICFLSPHNDKISNCFGQILIIRIDHWNFYFILKNLFPTTRLKSTTTRFRLLSVGWEPQFRVRPAYFFFFAYNCSSKFVFNLLSKLFEVYWSFVN